MSVYLDRLYHLRDVVFPMAEGLARLGKLDFNVYYESKLGAYCLLGTATLTEKLKNDGWYIMMFGRFSLCALGSCTGRMAAVEYYGINYYEADLLFGPRKFGGAQVTYELGYRKICLNRIIEQKERSLYEIADKITGAIGRVVLIDEFTELCRRAFSFHRDHGRAEDVPSDSRDSLDAIHSVPRQGEIVGGLQGTHTSPSREEESVT